ncbi:uncharacterized protein LOC127130297 [Lathyrus oleraceus]|uniref:uncharacterized protein LOC127130297 n=1 Tax=Pisum sativum TaxID=3888 RepID=UPI0021D0941D|nr:uncharacterized protein LOC127130297 [Pisum sativum]
MELLQVINAKMDTQPTVVYEINTTAAVDPPVVSVENPFPYGISQSFIHPPVVTSVQQTMPVAQSGQQAMPVLQNVQQTVPLVPEPPKVVPTFTQANVHTRVQPYLNEPVYEILDDNDEGYQPRDRLREEVVTIDKRLRKMEGDQIFGAAARDICLVSGLVIPPKFKTPNFDCYEGTTCPKSHLIMYYCRMAAHVENDKLMIHCFQDSLKGASSKWYLTLDQSRIKSFQDLSDAFIKHYKYNMDLAPNRRQLLSMTQKSSKTFKEYAQRWREIASQVEPPLTDKELADWFVDTVRPEFYERMVGSVTTNFADIVAVGVKVELAMKSGKMSSGSSSTSSKDQAKKTSVNPQRKKEGETHDVSSDRRRNRQYQYPPQYAQPQGYPVQYAPPPYVAAVAPSFNQQAPQAPVYQPIQQVPSYPPPVYPPPNYQQASNAPASQQPRNQAPHQNAPRRLYKTCPPIPMTFTELYPYLVQRGLVITRALGPPPNPLSANYNTAAHCLFHEGAPGHDLEN